MLSFEDCSVISVSVLLKAVPLKLKPREAGLVVAVKLESSERVRRFSVVAPLLSEGVQRLVVALGDSLALNSADGVTVITQLME